MTFRLLSTRHDPYQNFRGFSVVWSMFLRISQNFQKNPMDATQRSQRLTDFSLVTMTCCFWAVLSGLLKCKQMKTEYKGKRNIFLAKSLKYFFQRQISFLYICILLISKLILASIYRTCYLWLFSFRSNHILSIQYPDAYLIRTDFSSTRFSDLLSFFQNQTKKRS